MLKKLLITSILALCLIINTQIFVSATESIPVKPGKENKDLCQTSIISMLYDDIDKAITERYGEYRGHDLFDASIVNITKPSGQGWGTHNITVQVYTFSGPHNPPYGTEIMTFRISLGEKPVLIDYKHKDRPS